MYNNKVIIYTENRRQEDGYSMRFSHAALLSCFLATAMAADVQVETVSDQEKRSRDKMSLFFTGEWLYWNTRQGGMQYATRYDPVSGDMANAHTKNVEFHWHSGWRCGAGWNFGYDRWHLYFSYTLFRPQAREKTSGVLFPYLMYQGNILVTATVVDEASAEWLIDFQTWNLEIGRKCSLSEVFSLRPYAGVKGAWIGQHAHVEYLGGPTTPPGGEYDIRLKQKFRGVGVRSGLDSIWAFGAGFSLAGNISGSLLWGTFDVKQTQTLLTLPLIGWNDSIKAMAPMFQALLKLSWDRCFCRFHFGIYAGLEMQYWWEQNINERFIDSLFPISVKTREDLGFYGGVLGGRFDF